MKVLSQWAAGLLLTLTTTAALAVDVAGHVVYKMPSGELVSREVTLDVPPRGQGKVILKSKHGNVESVAFRTKHINNRVVFDVLFANPPGAPAHTAMAMTGSYLHGTNAVIYYGDVYSRTYTGMNDQEIQWQADFDSATFDGTASDWKHSAGFMFTNMKPTE